MEPVWAVVAGRMGSSRLPGKTLADLAGKPSLAHIVDRLRRVRDLDGILFATTDRAEDDAIRALAAQIGVPVFSGSSDDVLGRTLAAARSVSAETIVQVTGDCPLVDPGVVGRVLDAYRRERPDYASNFLGRHTFPPGLEVEVFSTAVLAEVDRVATEPRDREHVTTYVYEHPERYRLVGVEAEGREHRPELWLCIDTEEDHRRVRSIFEALWPRKPDFDYADVLDHLEGA